VGHAARNALRALTEHARSRATAIDGHAGGDDDHGSNDDDMANDAGGVVGADSSRGTSGPDEFLRLSTEDVASMVVAASSSEDDDDDDDDSGDDTIEYGDLRCRDARREAAGAGAVAATTTATTTPTTNALDESMPAARAPATTRAALGDARTTTRTRLAYRRPTPLPSAAPLLVHPREARNYLRGARVAAGDFVRRHAEPMWACVVDVATFERQHRQAGALPLSAIDVQIAARRVRQLRMHYGMAALALHRDAATLRRQLVDGLVARRRVKDRRF
jgi:hypothetical protein